MRQGRSPRQRIKSSRLHLAGQRVAVEVADGALLPLDLLQPQQASVFLHFKKLSETVKRQQIPSDRHAQHTEIGEKGTGLGTAPRRTPSRPLLDTRHAPVLPTPDASEPSCMPAGPQHETAESGVPTPTADVGGSRPPPPAPTPAGLLESYRFISSMRFCRSFSISSSSKLSSLCSFASMSCSSSRAARSTCCSTICCTWAMLLGEVWQVFGSRPGFKGACSEGE